MFKNEFKLKTLGIISSISGWLTIVFSIIGILVGIFMLFDSFTVGVGILYILGSVLYFFLGIGTLAIRVLTDKALNE